MGVPGLVNGFCYDYLNGAEPASKGEETVGFGIAPSQDLTPDLAADPNPGSEPNTEMDLRLDRVAILLVSGPSGEMSFE